MKIETLQSIIKILYVDIGILEMLKNDMKPDPDIEKDFDILIEERKEMINGISKEINNEKS